MPEASETRSGTGRDRDERSLVSLVVPAYNEEAILTRNLEILGAFMASLEDRYRWEMVIVNDGSRDQASWPSVSPSTAAMSGCSIIG